VCKCVQVWTGPARPSQLRTQHLSTTAWSWATV
jgi:hypothetical protein